MLRDELVPDFLDVNQVTSFVDTVDVAVRLLDWEQGCRL